MSPLAILVVCFLVGAAADGYQRRRNKQLEKLQATLDETASELKDLREQIGLDDDDT